MWRLSRPAAVRHVRVLHSPFDHGWGRETELLVLGQLPQVVQGAFHPTLNGGRHHSRGHGQNPGSDKTRSLASRRTVAAGLQRGAESRLRAVIDSCHVRIQPPPSCFISTRNDFTPSKFKLCVTARVSLWTYLLDSQARSMPPGSYKTALYIQGPA